MARTKDDSDLRADAGGAFLIMVKKHETVQFVKADGTLLGDDAAFAINADGTLDFHGAPVVTKAASVKVTLPDAPGQPSGWLRMAEIEKGTAETPALDPVEFAWECAFQEGFFEVSGHYLATVAQLRSGLVNGETGVDRGLFGLRASEWAAEWNAATFKVAFSPAEQRHWRNQCTLFGLMTRWALDSYRAAFNAEPSAVDLYLTQLLGTAALKSLKGDPAMTVDAALTAAGPTKMPPGAPAPAEQMARYATILKKAGAGCVLADLIAQARAVLEPAIAATASLFADVAVTPVPADVAIPASAASPAVSIPGLTDFHRAFDDLPGGVRWKLVGNGLLVEGEPAPIGTAGPPSTVKRIWDSFQNEIVAAAAEFGVPVELIIATIGAESSGDPLAERHEPGFVSETATPGRISVGLMQTLISTARGEAARLGVGEGTITAAWLRTAGNSIRAGTSYVARQKPGTGFDPPKVACAYNAGSLRRDDSGGNRWRMVQFPIGTSEHADRWVKWFNDCFRHFPAIGVTPDVSFLKMLGAPPPAAPSG